MVYVPREQHLPALEVFLKSMATGKLIETWNLLGQTDSLGPESDRQKL